MSISRKNISREYKMTSLMTKKNSSGNGSVPSDIISFAIMNNATEEEKGGLYFYNLHFKLKQWHVCIQLIK